jgi:hypothetical protein
VSSQTASEVSHGISLLSDRFPTPVAQSYLCWGQCTASKAWGFDTPFVHYLIDIFGHCKDELSTRTMPPFGSVVRGAGTVADGSSVRSVFVFQGPAWPYPGISQTLRSWRSQVDVSL